MTCPASQNLSLCPGLSPNLLAWGTALILLVFIFHANGIIRGTLFYLASFVLHYIYEIHVHLPSIVLVGSSCCAVVH